MCNRTSDSRDAAPLPRESARHGPENGNPAWSETLFPHRESLDLDCLRWKSSDLLWGILFLVIWRITIGLLTRNLASVHPVLVFSLGTLLPTVLVTLFPIWAYRRAGGKWPIAMGDASRLAVEAVWAIPGIVALIVGTIVVSLLYKLWTGDNPGMAEGMRELVFSRNIPLFLFFAVMACLWAPLSEELFFRGFLFNALARWMPRWIAGCLQALLFAAVHQYSGIHFVVILLVGLLLTAFYAWRKTLLATILIHAGFNTYMTLMLFLFMQLMSNAPVLGVVADVESDECRIHAVIEGTAADQAGLQAGDVIRRLGKKDITSFADLQEALLTFQPGDQVEIEFVRAGEVHFVKATLTKRPETQKMIREARHADGSS